MRQTLDQANAAVCEAVTRLHAAQDAITAAEASVRNAMDLRDRLAARYSLRRRILNSLNRHISQFDAENAPQ